MKYQISNIKYQKDNDKSTKIFQLTNYNLRPDVGQIVLILVLVTIVGLTIGLSVISRSITDVRISSQIEQSNRAFSAAEAGIETVLNSYQLVVTPKVINLPGASARYDVTAAGGGGGVYQFPSITEENNSAVLWLIAHKDDGRLDETGYSFPPSSPLNICWRDGQSATPAMILTLFYKLGSDYLIAKGAYDPINTSRPANKFLSADTDSSESNFCGGGFRFKKTITPTVDFGIDNTAVLLILRIQPIYDKTKIAVQPGIGNLPVQGKIINSLGQTSTGVIRKITVNQGYPFLPILLDFSLYNMNSNVLY